MLAVLMTVSVVPMQSFAEESQSSNQKTVNTQEDSIQKNDAEESVDTEQKTQEIPLEDAEESVDTKQKTQEILPEEEQKLIEDTYDADTQSMADEGGSTSNVQEQLPINYVVVDKPYVRTPETQNILVGLGDETSEIGNPILNVTREEDGTIFQIPLSKQDGDAYLFTKDYATEVDSGVYRVTSITYILNGVETTQNLSEFGYDVRYGVNKEVTTNPDEVVVEEEEDSNSEDGIDIITIDENGNTTSQNTIQDAIADASSENPMAQSRGAGGNVVVVLDPGHDNFHKGAQQSGLKEEELNLKIAKYCKEELEKYAGVTVYLTRSEDGSCPYPGTVSGQCNSNRVAFAKSVGANVYVSIHLNSAGASAHGAEIYYPTSNYRPELGEQGKQLASAILDKLVALGLRNRGIKAQDSDKYQYPDGSKADNYQVIRESKEAGIPAVLIEHAFMTNAGDVSTHLNNEAGLKNLGVADATGIAEYFGLSKTAINGICYIRKDNGIDVGASYVSVGTNTRFRWQAYNLDTKEWEMIADWNGGNWATWNPEKGNYWLQVEILTDEGYSDSRILCFAVDKNYSLTSVELNGICYLYRDDGIDVGVAYTTRDSNVSFRWLAYNLDTQQWETISDWNGGNWATWKPKKGNYWLQAQAKNSKGQIESATICFSVSKDYVVEPLTLDGITYLIHDDSIDVGVAYTSTTPNVKFKWQAYNLDTKEWESISNWYEGNWATWNPKKGNYWLHVEAKTTSGVTKDYTICFAVDKDRTPNRIGINGICVQSGKIGIDIGVAYETKASNAKFKYSIYNLDKQQWSTLNDWTSSNWVTWYPENGNYWIYVEAMTDKGITDDHCIGYTVNERTAIMGNSSTTLSQMVNYYLANAVYPSFYGITASQGVDGATTLERFCQLYLEECVAEGVKAEVAFCQAMKETGFLRFGGDVSIAQFNFAGLGATGGGVSGNSFSTVREGIRAQVQHLKAYASMEPLNNSCVDPRFTKVTRGTAPYVEWLGIQENPYGMGWATASGYGYSIKNHYMAKLFQY